MLQRRTIILSPWCRGRREREKALSHEEPDDELMTCVYITEMFAEKGDYG